MQDWWRSGPVWTHNSISLVRLSKSRPSQSYHRPETKYSSFQARPDINVQNAFELNIELDVSIAHPWCPDIILFTAQSSGSAALRREEKKKETYSSENIQVTLTLLWSSLCLTTWTFGVKMDSSFCIRYSNDQKR